MVSLDDAWRGQPAICEEGDKVGSALMTLGEDSQQFEEIGLDLSRFDEHFR